MYFKLVRVFAIGVIVVGLVTTANAQQSGPVAQSADAGKQTVDVGKYEYDGHCAICHGVSGTGQGIEPYWSYLSKTPANLTTLSKNNGGVFPGTETAARKFEDKFQKLIKRAKKQHGMLWPSIVSKLELARADVRSMIKVYELRTEMRSHPTFGRVAAVMRKQPEHDSVQPAEPTHKVSSLYPRQLIVAVDEKLGRARVRFVSIPLSRCRRKLRTRSSDPASPLKTDTSR